MSTRLRSSTTAKVAGFVALLAAVFGGTWVAGAEVGPVGSTSDDTSTTHSAGHDSDATNSEQVEQDEMDETTHSTGSGALPGLAVAQDGYRLVLADSAITAGTRPVSFAIEGPDGHPVTAFDVKHEKQLHLVVVRRDHAGFQHLHPTLDRASGTWSAQADLTPGSWRVFADFTPTDGPALVLGSDLLVPGNATASDPVGEARTDTVDGYTVTVDGTLVPGDHSSLTLHVTRDGAAVTDLEPYLGAYGHLVALREGDLAYLHMHPGGEPGDGRTQPGPEIEFATEVPSAGRYHLYLDFQHDDAVRTAHFILDAGPGTDPAGRHGGTAPDTDSHGGDGHSH